jgi:hypothetical protein
MMDEKIIEEGFWISDKNDKDNIGVKIIPVYGTKDEIESVEILTIDHGKDNNTITIFKDEFRKLIQFADLLREELAQ